MHEEEATKSKFALPGGNGMWAVIALAMVAGVVLLGWLLRTPAPSPSVRMAAQTPSEATVAEAPQEPVAPHGKQESGKRPGQGASDMATALPDANATIQNGYQGFEETLGVPLERIVRQIDYALVETLLLTGYDPHVLTIEDVALKSYHDEQYHYQNLQITLESAPDRFLDTLGQALKKWAPEATLNVNATGGWEVAVMGSPTHGLEFAVSEPEPATQTSGLMAVVIDDMGRNLHFAKSLAELPYPVTFSVLPHQPHTSEVAELAAQKGRELLLHLPMEPKGYPKVNPGKGALFTTMTAKEMRAVLAEDLAQVPGARGANNHMGSRFTQTAPAMAVVMETLKDRGMYFLDSLTAPRSQGVPQAHAAGLPVYRRSVFLDNIRDTGAILRQLEKAERLAAGTGQAVAIGHPYPETLAALKEWGQRRERAARVVPVRTLKPVTK